MSASFKVLRACGMRFKKKYYIRCCKHELFTITEGFIVNKLPQKCKWKIFLTNEETREF